MGLELKPIESRQTGIATTRTTTNMKSFIQIYAGLAVVAAAALLPNSAQAQDPQSILSPSDLQPIPLIVDPVDTLYQAAREALNGGDFDEAAYHRRLSCPSR